MYGVYFALSRYTLFNVIIIVCLCVCFDVESVRSQENRL